MLETARTTLGLEPAVKPLEVTLALSTGPQGGQNRDFLPPNLSSPFRHRDFCSEILLRVQIINVWVFRSDQSQGSRGISQLDFFDLVNVVTRRRLKPPGPLRVECPS